MERLLKLLAAHAGIALLHFAEQALFGGQQDALAVGVDGAAFEDEAALLTGRESTAGCHSRRFEQFGDASGNLVVEVPVVDTWPRR